MYRLIPHCCSTYRNSIASVSRVKSRENLIPICSQNSNKIVREIFTGEKDRFNGITIDLAKEKCELAKFNGELDESLNNWHLEEKRCIWFKVNIKDAAFVPMLAQSGFNFHHARDDFVMMYKWLPTDSEPNLPPSSYTNLGVGAMVFNKDSKLLVVSEKNYDYPHWKLPGGYVERGEDIVDAAIREVKEETGIDSEFESLVTFRHTHNMMFENSDIYVLIRMKALTEDIIISPREVNACKWMDVEDYTDHPYVHTLNKLIVKKALEYKDRNLTLSLKKMRVHWATFVRDMNYLIIEEVK